MDKTKSKIVKFTFLSAAVVILVCSAVAGRAEANRYRRELDAGYQRSIIGLAENIDSIDVNLKKSLSVGTNKQFTGIAAKLWAQAAQAKMMLGELPVNSGELEQVNAFLSQVGDYAMSICDSELGDEEYSQLSTLSDYAGRLRVALEDIVVRLDDGDGWNEETARMASVLESAVGDVGTAAGAGIESADEALEEYTTLIYDGPFSDHVFERAPQLTGSLPEIDQESAQRIAWQLSGADVYFTGIQESSIPSYIFSDGSTEIGITKNGGKVSYLLSSRPISQASVSVQEAQSKAQRFLLSCGYIDMQMQHYEILDDRCVINYAYVTDGITIYPDQMRVSVALDNGDIIAFDARDYIINHTDRKMPPATQTQEQARKVLNSKLTVTDCKLAIIPSAGLNELLCYEFLCVDEHGAQVLVYVNANTLDEENVLLYVQSQNGQLTV